MIKTSKLAEVVWETNDGDYYFQFNDGNKSKINCSQINQIGVIKTNSFLSINFDEDGNILSASNQFQIDIYGRVTENYLDASSRIIYNVHLENGFDIYLYHDKIHPLLNRNLMINAKLLITIKNGDPSNSILLSEEAIATISQIKHFSREVILTDNDGRRNIYHIRFKDTFKLKEGMKYKALIQYSNSDRGDLIIYGLPFDRKIQNCRS